MAANGTLWLHSGHKPCTSMPLNWQQQQQQQPQQRQAPAASAEQLSLQCLDFAQGDPPALPAQPASAGFQTAAAVMMAAAAAPDAAAPAAPAAAADTGAGGGEEEVAAAAGAARSPAFAPGTPPSCPSCRGHSERQAGSLDWVPETQVRAEGVS